ALPRGDGREGRRARGDVDRTEGRSLDRRGRRRPRRGVGPLARRPALTRTPAAPPGPAEHNGPVSSSTTNRPLANRALIAEAPRVVVKIGSSSLTRPDGSLNYERFAQISEIIAGRAAEGRQVVLVTSGSIAAGLAPLGLTERPKDLA